ncbi:MAG: GNAT family N-acetyltransferase [Rhodospirillales bacterium]
MTGVTGAAPVVRLAPFTGGAAEWDKTCARFPDFCVTQSWAAAEARCAADPRWRPERLIFMRGGAVAGCAQVMLRRAPFGLGRLAWIARGPLFDAASDAENRFAVWRAAAAELRARYARGFGGYLRIAPPILADAAPGDSPPELPGFRVTAQAGWASASVDLTPPVDDLRAGLKGKWRNALSKAERAGAQVRAADDETAVRAFAEGHDAFMAALGAHAGGSVTGAWINALAGAGGDVRVFEARLSGAAPDSAPDSPPDSPLAGRVMTVRTGARVEYLAGHTEPAGRDAGAGQMLLWAALAAAKDAGAQKFDLGGMDPVKTPKGVYDYKDGMQGAPYRMMNEIDACGGAGARLIRARTDAARAAMGA